MVVCCSLSSGCSLRCISVLRDCRVVLFLLSYPSDESGHSVISSFTSEINCRYICVCLYSSICISVILLSFFSFQRKMSDDKKPSCPVEQNPSVPKSLPRPSSQHRSITRPGLTRLGQSLTTTSHALQPYPQFQPLPYIHPCPSPSSQSLWFPLTLQRQCSIRRPPYQW